MTPDIIVGAVLLVAFISMGIVVGLRNRAPNPRAVLRRCRLELYFVRHELSQIPATREVHDMLAEIGRTEWEIKAKDEFYRDKERLG